MALYNKGTRDIKKEHYEMGILLTEDKKKEILKENFLKRVGYELNFDNPQTFNEKIMWSKLYYQNPLITKCCDKFAVKEYVTEKIGSQYIVKNICQWDDPDDIDFDQLPDRFVLKVNWSSGYNIVCSDKSKLNKKKTIEKLKKWMEPDRNAYYQFFNWGFKHMKPVVYAEEYLEQVDGQVYDYKFFTFNGKVKMMFIATDRLMVNQLTHDFFDRDFNLLPFSYGGRKHADPLPPKPKNFEKMIELAEKLAEPFPFCRVDFYEIGDDIRLGEMTFYPGGGILAFDPVEWDYKVGEWYQLPEKMITDKPGLLYPARVAFAKMKQKIKTKFNGVRRKIIRREHVKKQKYLRLFGRIRIPYSTHIESEQNCRRKYVTVLGIQVCYKKLPKLEAAINTNTKFTYNVNTPLENYMLEGKITPQMQRIHCEQKAYKQLKYFPNLKNPKSLNEKIIWLALNYKNPNIAVAADKAKAKDWISSRIGEEYVVPLLGVYEDVNDIDFDALPNQFVAKLNDGWGADKVMIVRDKTELDIDRTKAVLSSWLYPWNNYYYQNMCITDEKMETPTIIIEEYLENEGCKMLNDYKFYCCNGEPKFALIVQGRGTKHEQRSFIDMDWNVLPFSRGKMEKAEELTKPEFHDELIRICRTLSEGFPFVRIDFYQVNGKLYVGEMTFTPGMFLRFNPKEWDFILGDYLELPEVTE